MEGLVCLPRDFNLPAQYDYEAAVENTVRAIQYSKQVACEAAVYAGMNLVAIKEHEGQGNWYKALERMDMEPKTAERLMKLARAFGENPAVINGLSQRKALQAASFVEDNLLQLRKDQVFIDPEGNAYTLAEIQESVEKQMVNLRNQKNAEVREWKNKAENLQVEMRAMEREYKRQAELNEQLMRDANSSMLTQMQAKDKLLQDKNKELDELRGLTLEQQEEKKTGEEALAAIVDYRGNVIKAVSVMNTVKLVRDQKLRAEYYGALTWARELLKSLEERAYAYFGPMIEIDPKDLPEEER